MTDRAEGVLSRDVAVKAVFPVALVGNGRRGSFLLTRRLPF